MGGIKGWEKTLNESELFHYYNSEKGGIILRGQKIYRDWSERFKKPRWRISVGGSIQGTLLKDYIKTKSSALNFAKSWMRKHPRG